jgi:hypothetical protein
MRSLVACALLTAVFAVQAQNCPKVDPHEQKTQEAACRAAGGQWARFGVHDHLCNVYSCAPRTGDGGKACSNRADCEYLCVIDRAAAIGTAVTGKCAPYRTSFGCSTHVDGGKVVGRVCVD